MRLERHLLAGVSRDFTLPLLVTNLISRIVLHITPQKVAKTVVSDQRRYTFATYRPSSGRLRKLLAFSLATSQARRRSSACEG